MTTRPVANDQTATVAAGFLGWTLDAFDFFLVVMTLTAIARDFGKSDAAVALSITITLAFRPVGALIFGLLADRYGRKIPLMVDLVFYSVIEVLSGLAPNYTTFLVLRALFGIGMGAEWGVGASLVMEKVPARLRGVMSGLLQQGYAAGYLLAALCYLLVFPHWGWRPLFFIGGLPALLALFVRARVQESAVWRETHHENWSGLGRAIASNWKLFLYLTGLMAMMNMVSHGTQDMYPTFLERDWGFRPTPCEDSYRGSPTSAAWRSRARSRTCKHCSPRARATHRPWRSPPPSSLSSGPWSRGSDPSAGEWRSGAGLHSVLGTMTTFVKPTQ